eukprot:14265333-Alexandrium_andersonii.AAC.1
MNLELRRDEPDWGNIRKRLLTDRCSNACFTEHLGSIDSANRQWTTPMGLVRRQPVELILI